MVDSALLTETSLIAHSSVDSVTHLQQNAMKARRDMQQVSQLMFTQVCKRMHQSAACLKCQLGWHLKVCRLYSVVNQAQLSTHSTQVGNVCADLKLDGPLPAEHRTTV